MDAAKPVNIPSNATPNDRQEQIKKAKEDFDKELEDIYLKFLKQLEEIVKE